MIKKHLSRTPLLLRVVFAYVGIFIAGWGIHAYEFDVLVRQSSVPKNTASDIRTVRLSHSQVTGSHPVTLRIDAIRLEQDIHAGSYNYESGTWALSDDAVQFATMTTPPNHRSGTTLLYGHNTWRVLEKTAMLQQGDLAIVTTSDEREYQYRYTKSASVLPSNTTILSESTKEPRLVLMTCEGWNNEHRRLYYFEIISDGGSA